MSSKKVHEPFMRRCFYLAQQAGKEVRPNPRVGSVLVYNNKIIGEGFHHEAGKEHAEVNCIQSVKPEDLPLIPESTLYVSLEPCSIIGKTPACTDLIISHQIKKVVISTLDPNPLVYGNGVQALKDQGIEVVSEILEKEGKDLISPFMINQLQKRPYVILKLVKSKDHKIGQKGKKIWLSNQASTELSHKWRNEIDAILVGTNTVINDNPSLDNRYFGINQPIRISLDRENRISEQMNIKNGKQPTLIFTQNHSQAGHKNLEYINIDFESKSIIGDILNILFDHNIYVLMVEGGAKMIRSFLDSGLWDEARVISCPQDLYEGINAPNIRGKLWKKVRLDEDEVQYILNN